MTQSETEVAASAEPSQSWVEHPTTVRWLQVLVVVLGIILIIGFAAVIARIAYLAVGSSEDSSGPAQPVSAATGTPPAAITENRESIIELPKDAVVRSTVGTGQHVFVHFEDPKGAGGILFDPQTGAIIRRWRFKSR